MSAPDGRWAAYMSDESGRNDVYVLQFPGPGGKRQATGFGDGGLRIPVATWLGR